MKVLYTCLRGSMNFFVPKIEEYLFDTPSLLFSLTFGDNVGDYNGSWKKQEDVEGEEGKEEEGSPL